RLGCGPAVTSTLHRQRPDGARLTRFLALAPLVAVPHASGPRHEVAALVLHRLAPHAAVLRHRERDLAASDVQRLAVELDFGQHACHRLLDRGLELLLRDPVLAGRAVLPVAARIALRTVAAVAAGCAVLARRARVALLSPFAWRSGRALGAGLALLATRAGLADDTAQVPHGAVGQAQQQMSVTSNLGVRDADAVCATLALRPRWPGLALLATRAGLATLALRPALARWPLRAGRPGGPGLATLALRPALARWPLRAGRPGGSGLAFLAALRRRLLAQLGQELVADLDTHRPQARIHGVHEPLDGGEDAVAHAAT